MEEKCPSCKRRPVSKGFRYCDKCVQRIINAVREENPLPRERRVKRKYTGEDLWKDEFMRRMEEEQ